MNRPKINKNKVVRKNTWINEENYLELKLISNNPKNKISFFILINDLIFYALKNLNYDKKTGEIK